MNAYSVAGAFTVDFKTTAGTKVIMAPLATLLNYCDAALRLRTSRLEWTGLNTGMSNATPELWY